MQTFQDMIKVGIAPAQYQEYLPEIPSMDQLVRYYNMYWGTISSTHMTETPDGYLITGSRINNKKLFRQILTADSWEQVKFPSSFAYIMMHKGLCGTTAIINGWPAFVISKWTEEGPNPVFLDAE